MISTILSLCAISFLVYGSSATNFAAYAQSDLQTIKYRDMVIDLGNGVKTNTQLTYSGPEGRMKIRSTLDALFDSAFLQGAHIFPLNRY